MFWYWTLQVYHIYLLYFLRQYNHSSRLRTNLNDLDRSESSDPSIPWLRAWAMVTKYSMLSTTLKSQDWIKVGWVIKLFKHLDCFFHWCRENPFKNKGSLSKSSKPILYLSDQLRSSQTLYSTVRQWFGYTLHAAFICNQFNDTKQFSNFSRWNIYGRKRRWND